MGGLGNFVTMNEVIANRWEIRPWQGVNVSWPRAPVHLEHFLRLEEQFDFNTETWESQNSVRGRYRLRTVIQWSALQQDRYWRLHASVEGFLTLAGEQGQFREQFRLTVGIERSVKAGVRTRFDATWQREGRLLVEGAIDQLFLSVRLLTAFGG